MALHYAEIKVEHREISLREKPRSMLEASPKGTVPVLCVGNQVIDQSVDIMHWALQKNDPKGWRQVDHTLAQGWVDKNDGPFKQLLDQYKYPNRFPELNSQEVLHQACVVMLDGLEAILQKQTYLMGDKLSWVDIAIFPFIRQFSMVNTQQFSALPLPATQHWLQQLIESQLFEAVMVKHPTWTDSDK
jgi:glutathione S-transferase